MSRACYPQVVLLEMAGALALPICRMPGQAHTALSIFVRHCNGRPDGAAVGDLNSKSSGRVLPKEIE